jgi:hypothetical protein
MNQSTTYQIQVQGCLPRHWPDFFGQLTASVTDADGEPITTLTGTVADQAALHGILQTLYTLGLPILTVQHIDTSNSK